MLNSFALTRTLPFRIGDGGSRTFPEGGGRFNKIQCFVNIYEKFNDIEKAMVRTGDERMWVEALLRSTIFLHQCLFIAPKSFLLNCVPYAGNLTRNMHGRIISCSLQSFLCSQPGT